MKRAQGKLIPLHPILDTHTLITVPYLEKYIIPQVKECRVISDDIHNASDHLAIVVHLDIHYQSQSSTCIRQQVAWHKLERAHVDELFTQPLELAVYHLLRGYGVDTGKLVEMPHGQLINNESDMDTVIQNLTETIQQTSAKLPHTKFNKALKPYWCDALCFLSQEKKIAWVQLVQTGKPRNEQYPILIRYKESKRNFRREQRRKEYDYEQDCMKKLAESEDIVRTHFWHIINKHKKHE